MRRARMRPKSRPGWAPHKGRPHGALAYCYSSPLPLVGTLAAVRRALVPAALSFCEQFAVFEVTVQRFGAETTQCSQDLSHFFDDCTHDFLFARVSA